MDREILEKHLALAELHVAKGELLIVRQRELTAKLLGDGHEVVAASATSLLRLFEETQKVFVADRDRIKKELSEQISN